MPEKKRSKNSKIGITGVGCFLPKKVLTNSDLEQMVDDVLMGLDMPEHHGRGGAQAQSMGHPHHFQPPARQALARGDL